jgi:histidine triad (HIT) family protein
MSECIFCDIISEASPAHLVFEDDASLAFLDTRPLFPGHVLLVPRDHVPTLPDLSSNQVPAFFENVQLMSKAVPLAMESEGSFVAMNNKLSQSVPHLHVHIVPRSRQDGLRGFFWPRTLRRRGTGSSPFSST